MRIKTLLKKWHLLAVTMLLLIASLGILAMPVSAQDLPIPTTGNMVVGTTFGPASNDEHTYVDIMINGGPVLPGWCVDHVNVIYVGTTYPVTVYDYFGQYYPNWVDPLLPLTSPYLPATVRAINWYAVTYIINHKVGDWNDVQNAIWFFTNGLAYTAGTNTATMVNGALSYLGSHGGVYVPETGKLEPMVCYVDSGTQLIFFEYPVPEPTAPLPEMPAAALFGIGLVGLVGFITIKKRATTVTNK